MTFRAGLWVHYLRRAANSSSSRRSSPRVDSVALEWRVQARTAVGQSYDNDYCGFFVIRDGKIVAVREYLDTRYAAKVLFHDLESTERELKRSAHGAGQVVRMGILRLITR
jgi:hypothetical protein